MDDETTRLRALLKGIALPWKAQPTVVDGDEVECLALVLCPHGDDGDRDMVAEIDMGHGVECDDAHAALIVAAVNALPGLLDRVEAAERERDVLRAQQAPLLDAHDALVAAARAAGWTGAGATGAELVAWVRRGAMRECLAVARGAPDCTGITAQWCPRCGDCTCPALHEGGDPGERTLDDPACPLHAPSSPHGDAPGGAT